MFLSNNYRWIKNIKETTTEFGSFFAQQYITREIIYSLNVMIDRDKGFAPLEFCVAFMQREDIEYSKFKIFTTDVKLSDLEKNVGDLLYIKRYNFVYLDKEEDEDLGKLKTEIHIANLGY